MKKARRNGIKIEIAKSKHTYLYMYADQYPRCVFEEMFHLEGTSPMTQLTELADHPLNECYVRSMINSNTQLTELAESLTTETCVNTLRRNTDIEASHKPLLYADILR